MVRVFSGVQPTGDLHLGNYLGAIKQFVKMQDTAECLFCVVDMHAITVKHDPKLLAQHTREIAAAYIACGIDTRRDGAKALIFAQSHVPAHAELAWLLNCVARMGWMERMVQFKDKAGENKERASVGLFTYPILMAADILAYRATHVPVGDDQKQHLNLARDIAEKFNHDYPSAPQAGDPREQGEGYFPVPIAVHSDGSSSRIMSLQDGTKKMSKSDPDPRSRINLSDSNDEIAKKIRRATAYSQPFPCDMGELNAIEPELNRMSVANMLNIYAAVTDQDRGTVFDQFGGQGYGVFKPALAEAVIATVEPIRTAIGNLLANPDHIRQELRNGADFANDMASKTVEQVKGLMGFEL
jgi:tryptophanyl-tRNA synthetase